MKKRKSNKNPLWTRIPFIRVWRDIENYRSWIRVIKEESYNPLSKFNKFNLDYNYFYVLYLAVSLPDSDSNLSENIKRLRLMEILVPIHQYLDEELGFAGNIIPEFNQFFDDEDKPTLTYGVIYRFAFDRLNLQYVVTRFIGLGIVIWILTRFHIIGGLIEAIKGLF
jgi:hypothetical protein